MTTMATKAKHVHAVAMQNTENEVALAETTPAEAPCLLTTPNSVLKENLLPGTTQLIFTI